MTVADNDIDFNNLKLYLSYNPESHMEEAYLDMLKDLRAICKSLISVENDSNTIIKLGELVRGLSNNSINTVLQGGSRCAKILYSLYLNPRYKESCNLTLNNYGEHYILKEDLCIMNKINSCF